eukprot:4914923-Prymnesium_polylepis.1
MHNFAVWRAAPKEEGQPAVLGSQRSKASSSAARPMGCALSSCREEAPLAPDEVLASDFEDKKPASIADLRSTSGALKLTMPKWFTSSDWAEGDQLPVKDASGAVQLWVTRPDEAIPDPRMRTIVRDSHGGLVAVLLKDRLSRTGCYIYSPRPRGKAAGKVSVPSLTPEQHRSHAESIEKVANSLNVLNGRRNSYMPKKGEG